MRSGLRFFVLSGVLVLLVSVFSRPESARAENLHGLLDEMWAISQKTIYPQSLEAKFTDDAFASLKNEIPVEGSLEQISMPFNRFLESLHVSHTAFYTGEDLDYYFLRSLFKTHDAKEPKIFQIGAHFVPSGSGHRVRYVVNGSPAESAGLKRGDLILMANGRPFHPIRSFSSTNPVDLAIERDSKAMAIRVVPVFESFAQTLEMGLEKSVRVLTSDQKKIGYVHLWHGAFDSARLLAQAIAQMSDTDGLILDLRDGFGAAWWDHLDPFFEDTHDYFQATWVGRDGKTTPMFPSQKQNPNAYLKPMVVLINEGVRSGKEALAFQFQKSRRAKLVGTRTAGAFVGGKGLYAAEDRGFILYMSATGLLLDGVDIEGVGVTPDVEVPYPLDQSFATDPQFDRGLTELQGMLVH